MEEYDLILRGMVLVFAVALLYLALMSYRRVPKRSLLLMAGAFGVLALKGIVLVIAYFDRDLNVTASQVWFNSVFDLAVLLLLFFGLFLRRGGRIPGS